MNAPSWRLSAACRGMDPEMFYPQRGDSTAAPKSVCRGCLVSEECLEFALDNGEKFGVWGGKSERQRRRMRGERYRALKAAS